MPPRVKFLVSILQFSVDIKLSVLKLRCIWDYKHKITAIVYVYLFCRNVRVEVGCVVDIILRSPAPKGG